MKKIEEYFVIMQCPGESRNIAEKVQKMIKLGYQPFGNLVAVSQNGLMYFYQPVVKYEE